MTYYRITITSASFSILLTQFSDATMLFNIENDHHILGSNILCSFNILWPSQSRTTTNHFKGYRTSRKIYYFQILVCFFGWLVIWNKVAKKWVVAHIKLSFVFCNLLFISILLTIWVILVSCFLFLLLPFPYFSTSERERSVSIKLKRELCIANSHIKKGQ